MFITTQGGTCAVNESSVKWFFLDDDNAIYANLGEEDGTLLMGGYKNRDKAIDVMVGITDAAWSGKNYRLPDDD